MEDPNIKVLMKAAQTGGEILKKYFGKNLNMIEKSILGDYQTEADLESEKQILLILKNNFPQYNIYSEENGKSNNDSEYTFVIDPLDGTNNFVMGIPNFSVSIALFYKNEAIAGVVFQPILDQTFFAIKGGGAFLNGNQIKVNNISNIEEITVAYTCGYKTEPDYQSRIMSKLLNSNLKRTLLNWSPAYEYCMLACGKIESVITDSPELYDYGAGKLIAKEAGAKVIDFTNNEEFNYSSNRFIISSNTDVNNCIMSLIKDLK